MFGFDVCLVVVVCYSCSGGVLLVVLACVCCFGCGCRLLVTGSTIADACGLSLLCFNS